MDRRWPWIQRPRCCHRFVTACGLLLLSAAVRGWSQDQSPEASAAGAKIRFASDVAPILKRRCIDCHGPTLQLGDLRLDQRQFAIVDGRDRGLIQPGRSGDSLLIQRLVDKQFGLIMPPTFPFFPEDKVGLPESEIRILKKWIDEGADWPKDVTLTGGKNPSADSAASAALFAAVRAAARPAVAQLLADRSLTNTVDRHGSTPLMSAAMYADTGIMQLLIEHGADVNGADRAGATPLMCAAGDLAKARLLIEHGAKVNAKSELGRTPLLIASTYPGNSAVVRLLLKSGATIGDRDTFGETCLTSAAKRGDVQLVETLIEAGADVTAGGGFVGRPPLAWAAEEGNAETVACLLKHGAGRDAKGLDTALFNAAVRGPVEAVELLVGHGARVNAHSGFAGYTPLMGAAYSETVSTAAVKLLLDRGADVNAKAATGETALQLARKRGHTAIVELLQQAGAKE